MAEWNLKQSDFKRYPHFDQVLKAMAVMESMPDRIKKYGDQLLIKPEKTSLVRYVADGDNQTMELLAGCQGKNGLEYLGFRYDGKNVYLRDATLSNLYRKVASAARSQANATVKRYPAKNYAQLCDMFNFEDFTKRFGRVEGFEGAVTHKHWTFWTYVTRSAEEFGSKGNTIIAQVKRLRKRSRHRVDVEVELALRCRGLAASSPVGRLSLSLDIS